MRAGFRSHFLYGGQELMKIKPLGEIVEFLQPVAKEVGVEIVDAAWDGRTHSLTVFIDMPGGLDLVTCEKFHRAIDGPLDELDPTFGAPYTLNCSSPGLDRPFKKEADYRLHIGEKVEVHLYAPIDGKKSYEGTLASYEAGSFTVETEKGPKTFEAQKCAKVCLLIEV